ncbi:MAG: glycosyltransferase [Frankiaceae bacterium]|nr:glycosyltransferase [Frankiaceae bacterium]
MSAADASPTVAGVVVIIPALNEEVRISATVGSAQRLANVCHVIVADDGSTDSTAELASAAGAQVVRHDRRRGKAAAMTTGAAAAREAGYGEYPLLFLDADLEASAANAGPLIAPVIKGAADMTIAVLPPAVGGGGRGFVMRLAASGIEQATGWRPTAPLSGQRCITRGLFDSVLPLAPGFGVETGLTIDALRHGAKVKECPADLGHRVTGTSFRDQRHRARQYRDVWRALAARRVIRFR